MMQLLGSSGSRDSDTNDQAMRSFLPARNCDGVFPVIFLNTSLNTDLDLKPLSIAIPSRFRCAESGENRSSFAFATR